MKRILYLFIVATLLVSLPVLIQAQCKGFAKNICKLELSPDYTHDGNYHAAILTEGEEAELYKTFYSGQDYRIAICGSDNMSDVEFRVLDAKKTVLYTNRDNDFNRIWDFKLESSQQLKIFVRVPVNPDTSAEPQQGCVAIMFGFKAK
ncbi:MAG: hypothetical protein JSV24_06850 [Bacteroidales bacterium]|nr:MAG: hypothetical protein JSV24_06850 [Bacteroidales bacterium]